MKSSLGIFPCLFLSRPRWVGWFGIFGLLQSPFCRIGVAFISSSVILPTPSLTKVSCGCGCGYVYRKLETLQWASPLVKRIPGPWTSWHSRPHKKPLSSLSFGFRAFWSPQVNDYRFLPKTAFQGTVPESLSQLLPIPWFNFSLLVELHCSWPKHRPTQWLYWKFVTHRNSGIPKKWEFLSNCPRNLLRWAKNFLLPWMKFPLNNENSEDSENMPGPQKLSDPKEAKTSRRANFCPTVQLSK